MRYTRSLFSELLLKDELFGKVKTLSANDPAEFSGGAVLNEGVNLSRNRQSEIRWIQNPQLRTLFDPIVADVNRRQRLEFSITHAEHFQHARYGVGNKYDWHADQPAPAQVGWSDPKGELLAVLER